MEVEMHMEEEGTEERLEGSAVLVRGKSWYDVRN